MNLFYLNDCLGTSQCSCKELSTGLVKAILAYTKLVNKSKLHISKGFVTEKEPDKMTFGCFSLKDIVQGMKDRECKRLFFIYCINYPIHEYFTKVDDEMLLKAEYKLGDEDAINIAIAAQNKGFLLSLPVSDNLKKDVITINSINEGYGPITIPNLHGYCYENVAATERELLDRNYEELDGLEKIECLAPNVKISRVFKDGFAQLSKVNKKSIFDRIDEAKKGHFLQPLRCNGTVIRHVEKHVAELRIVNPVDIRVYFHEDGDTLYFAKLNFKSNYVGKNDQNNDIKRAEDIITSLIEEYSLKRNKN